MGVDRSMDLGFDPAKTAAKFAFDGVFLKAVPHGQGHINDTYTVYHEGERGRVKRYILQRINTGVFKKPDLLMDNMVRVTEHLRKRITACGGDPGREALNLIPTRDGQAFYKSPEGEYWRGFLFIENARTYERAVDPGHMRNAGKAVGRFQELLADFPAESLHETIPGFHDTPKRFKAFLRALEEDTKNRAKDARAEIEFIESRADDTRVLTDLIMRKELPLEVTHNDTKLGNIMIDDVTGEGVCLVDLDTVMPGTALYDFGDAIRSGASSALEDEQDPDRVWMDLELYKEFTEGFLSAAYGSLNATELEYLPFSAKLMTLEQGIRFLTDYLNGDTYYKIKYEDHNLVRARTQLRLVRDMEQKADHMEQVVKGFISNNQL